MTVMRHRFDDDLGDLSQITGSDFEAVDVSSLMVDPDSGATTLSPLFAKSFESGDTSGWASEGP